ncbi:MAG TPA: Gfo/Idh/MocA family oxidoreductase, partial [Cyclobacteriaceae bacterium]|nr:Gfo/Idh/MocA family oxidoreductase [Cyclobacteriaceae bacterium]
MTSKKNISRRQFVGTAAASLAAVTIVPRHVLGGPGYVPPSEKLTLAYIGCGTQGLREMFGLIENPQIQITSVCDPNLKSDNYIDWSHDEIRNGIRRISGEPEWGSDIKGIPGGREVARYMIEKYYAKNKPSAAYKGCNSYADFRELLDKESDYDAVKVMTPDHLHAVVSIAAMNKKKHVVIHKPIANRIYEARKSIETARKTGVSTHLLAWSHRPGFDLAKQMIKDGMIGTLKEIHNWSNRPVWPQWTQNPTESVPVPEGFDWDLWLGPVPDRPYHPNYTHNVFRGWYDFGAGSIADMGTYSLWPLFLAFGFDKYPLSAEAYGTTTRQIIDNVSREVKNDVAFPYTSMIKFNFPAMGGYEPISIFWYDGGVRPAVPEELEADGKTFEREGMMFVGDKGKIVGSFHCD